jgi:hypothetical protein
LEAKTSGTIERGNPVRVVLEENDELSPNCVIAIFHAPALQYAMPVPPVARVQQQSLTTLWN